MKKGVIISLVVSILSFFIGVFLIIYSLELILKPMSIQDFNASVTASINYSSVSVYPLMPLILIILGCTIFISAILFLILSIKFFNADKNRLK